MREVSGTTWSFQMIIFFILIFAAFLTLVLNYSKAYMVKNEFLTIIEKYDGLTNDSYKILNNYLNAKSYQTTGRCPESNEEETWYGVSALSESDTHEEVNKGQNYYYCYNIVESEDKIYYNVILFYRFNLPVLGEIMKYQIKGRTDTIISADNILK